MCLSGIQFSRRNIVASFLESEPWSFSPEGRFPGLRLHSPLIGPFTAMAGSLWGKTPDLPNKHRCVGIIWAPAQPLLGQNPSLSDCKRPHPEISILLVCLVPQCGVYFQTCVWKTCPYLASALSYPQTPDSSLTHEGLVFCYRPLNRAQGRKLTWSDWAG